MQRRGDTITSIAPQVSGVLIQDVVVVSNVHECEWNGEFGTLNAPVETSNKTVERLFNKIACLAKEAKGAHLMNKYNHHPRAVTRLITNEFYFYTKHPLSLSDFEQLQEKIADLMKSMPENVHLVLGTFAVEVDDRIMNVAVHTIAGRQPYIKLIVKNWAAANDPVYVNPHTGYPLQNFSVRDNNDPGKYSISVDGKKHFFSHNNLSVWQVGNTEIYTPIDICLDHVIGVGKVNMEKYIYHLGVSRFQAAKAAASLPVAPTLLCASIVISDTVKIRKSNSVGSVTQADPIKTKKSCHPGTLTSAVTNYPPFGFGGTSWCYMLHPYFCGSLPQYESKLLHYLETTGYQPVELPLREETPALLQIAVLRGDTVVVKELLLLGANPTVFYGKIGSALALAIMKNVPEILAEILKYVSDNDLLCSDYSGYTPLGRACRVGNLMTLELLLSRLKNVDINKPVENGKTLLHIAMNSVDPVNIVELLLHHGADPNKVSKGCAPLCSAITIMLPRNYQVIKLLLDAGASLKLFSPGVGLPLGIAIKDGDIQLVKLLLQYASHGDICDIHVNGDMISNLAIESNNQEIIAELNKFNSAQRVQPEKKSATPSVKEHGMFKNVTSSDENPTPTPSQKK